MDIQQLADEAKQVMLTRGNVMPMIHLQLDKDYIILALDVINDHQSIPAQEGLLARLGWDECKKYPGQKPIAIGFYSEAWVSRVTRGEVPLIRPVSDPKRDEIIAVSVWHAEDNRTQQYALPIIRDHKKRVVDVGPAKESKSVASMHIQSFLRGCLDAQRPEEEVMNELTAAVNAKLKNVTPQQRQALEQYLRDEGLKWPL